MRKNFVERPEGSRPPRRIKVLRVIGMTIVGVVFAVGFALVFGLLVKLLWNWLMPVLFGFPAITYWQAFGIVLLAKLLFGGFGHHSKDHDHWNYHDKWSFYGKRWYDDDWMIEGGPKNWKYYHQYWREEGKAAFETYVKKMEQGKAKKSEEEEG